MTDQAAIKNWIKNIDNTNSLDLAIANAGASTNTPGKLKKTQLRSITDIIMFDVLNAIEPIWLTMALWRTGMVALMSSLAGWK